MSAMASQITGVSMVCSTVCSGADHRKHDDVIKWKHFPRNWPFVRGIHRSPVNSAHKGYWRRALMFSLICVWINGWVNNREAGDERRYRAHYDVTIMTSKVRVTGLCEENSPVTGEITSKRASNTENVSIWWRHHAQFLQYRQYAHCLCIVAFCCG